MYFTRRRLHIYKKYLAEFFLEWDIFSNKFLGRVKTHFMFSNVSFLENRALYEIMSKNMVEPEMPRPCNNTPTHPHARTHTHTQICNTAFPRQQWFRERALMSRDTYIAPLDFSWNIHSFRILNCSNM